MKPGIALSALLLLAAAPFAYAKQCVFNKGGYVLVAQWYKIGTLATHKHAQGAELAASGPPAQVDTLTAGFGACTKSDEPMVLLASIPLCAAVVVDGKSGACDKALVINGTPLGRWADPSNGGPRIFEPAQPVSCRSGGYCISDRNHGNLPDNRVLVIFPSSTQYLDFWGSIYNVTWGPGGPIR